MRSLRREYPLSTLLELIGMPRSTYYYHEANPPSDRQATERPAIVEICKKSQFRYGYRRVADTLRKATGVRIADKTVLKVMREEGLPCQTRRRRKYRSYMGQVGKSSPNLLARDFEAEDPMTKLVTDVTEFKVGGTKKGITAIQVDIKVDGLTPEIIREAFEKTRKARLYILDEVMAKAIAQPRDHVAEYAPKMVQIKIPVDKIREVIGQGGKVIQKISADCDVKIDVNEDGHVFISGISQEGCDKAYQIIETIAIDPEVGSIYKGKSFHQAVWRIR